jgi:hypothetical protein
MSESNQSSDNSGKSDDGNTKRPNNRNRNRNKNRNKNKNTNTTTTSGPNQKNTASDGKVPNPRRNNKRPRRRQPNPNHKLSGIEAVFRKYENLRELHIQARKKYFEQYFRAPNNKVDKLYRMHISTQKQMIDFVDQLAEQYKKDFNDKYHGLPLDTEYTSNHEIPSIPEAVSHQVAFEDPHYLKAQIESDYSAETEESSGSMDDYNSYKGL